MDDYNINELISNMDFNSNSYNSINDMMLTNREIEILERYHIPYKSCNNLKEVIYHINNILDEEDIVDEELETISMSISERDYYQNSNK